MALLPPFAVYNLGLSSVMCLLVAQVCKPKEFAAQINLSMEHCWGIVRALVDMLLKLDDGKFLLIKDPNKDLLR